MLSHIYYLPIDFNIIASEDCTLPDFLPSAIRGIFGRALRSNLCDNFDRACENCILSDECIYTKIFYCFGERDEKQVVYTSPYVVYHSNPILNYIEKGTCISFRITLFGKACAYLNDVILNIKKGLSYGLGSLRAKFSLFSASINRRYVYRDGDFIPSSAPLLFFNSCAINKEKVDFIFDSPLKIKSSSKTLDHLDFSILFENILRRVSFISEVYCDKKLDCTFNSFDLSKVKLINSNMHWQNRQRFSNRTKEKMSLGGLVGIISLEGDLRDFIPFFELGRVLHIGKNCSMGLGHYNLIYY